MNPTPHRDDEAGERAPLFGRWGPWYALVVLELVIVILVCALLAARNG